MTHKVEESDQLTSLSEKVLQDCVDVALILKNAHFIIVTAGAGMSAYSNLHVYADIAKVANFEKNDITYKVVKGRKICIWNSCFDYG